jgi:hypothetical protein
VLTIFPLRSCAVLFPEKSKRKRNSAHNSTQPQKTTPTPRQDLKMIVLFDGVCVMCNWCVHFVIDRDPEGAKSIFAFIFSMWRWA